LPWNGRDRARLLAAILCFCFPLCFLFLLQDRVYACLNVRAVPERPWSTISTSVWKPDGISRKPLFTDFLVPCIAKRIVITNVRLEDKGSGSRPIWGGPCAPLLSLLLGQRPWNRPYFRDALFRRKNSDGRFKVKGLAYQRSVSESTLGSVNSNMDIARVGVPVVGQLNEQLLRTVTIGKS
jgi:hypothetical protein